MGGDGKVGHSSDDVPINVNSFSGAGVVVRVAKKPGMESVSLLTGDDDDSESESATTKEKKKPNLWNTLSRCVCVWGEGGV